MKKIFLIALGIMMVMSANADTNVVNTSCNNFTLTVQNNTSDDIRVHYEVPGDGLPLKRSNRPIPGDVEVKKGETKEILTVVNPPKSTKRGWFESLNEGKIDSLHDNSNVKLWIYAKKENGKDELKFNKIIKKDVGAWKRFGTLVEFHPIGEGKECLLGVAKDSEVYKVVPGRITYDETFVSPDVINQPYHDELLSIPSVRVFANRCVFAEGECGPALSLDWKAQEDEAAPTDYKGVVTLRLTDPI